ncbi:MAG: translocation/assembly module TamB domain-containing protein [Pelomonas sp.]|nr:translocation/assembly module TamB domain-containing protein [Roseateles sp.]
MPRGARLLLKRLLGGLLALALLLAAAAGAVAALLGSAGGTAWLLGRVPGLTVDAPQGALVGDFAARSVVWRRGADTVRVTGLRWQGLHLGWRQLTIANLQADALDLALAPAPPAATPTPVPTELRLPLDVDVDVGRLRLGTLSLHGAPLVGTLDASLQLGQREHRLRVASLQWQQLRLKGAATLGATAPLALQAQLQVDGAAPDADLPPWQGRLELKGPLAALAAQGRLDAAGQHLQLKARLAPFAAWPLAALQADASELDLAALLRDAPHTALSGEARVQETAGAKTPQLDAALSLVNGRAGRWDAHALPVRSLAFELGGLAPDAVHQALVLRALKAELGTRAQAAGTLTGTGQLRADGGWQLDARLAGLQTEKLDAQLAALSLDGRVQLGGTAAGVYRVVADIAGNAAGAGTAKAGPPAASVNKSALAATPAKPGPSAPIAAALKLDASWQPHGPGGEQRVEVATARLTAGPGSASASGSASFDAQRWRTRLRVAADHLDLRRFVRGAPDSAWARGEHALNLDGSAELAGTRADLDDPLHRWPGGQAHLTLRPSLLAGAPLQGRLAAAGRELHAQLDAGGNHVAIDAHAEPGAIDAHATLDAPALAGLDALSALTGHRFRGALQGQLHVAGSTTTPWRSDGALTLHDVGVDGAATAHVADARLRWQLATALDAPLALDATLDQAQWQDRKLDHAELKLDGTLRAHHLALDVRAAGHALTLALDGHGDAAARRWRAHVAKLDSPGLATTAGLDLDVSFDAQGQPVAASLAPGRLRVGPASLAWQTARWAAPLHEGAPPDVALELALEPLAVAPLLAQQQPDMGWGGDLQVSGHASLHTLPQAAADIHLERASGDLSLRDDRGTRALGLKRVALGALLRDGHWALTAAFDGSDWGQLAARAELASPGLVPARDAALTGRVDARVADLASLGAWLPVGWRLGGALTAGVTLAGRADAPLVRGELAGTGLAARNRLLGVDVHDGRLQLALDGQQARLDAFDAQAGDGRFSATGTAELGGAPAAHLQLDAKQLTLLQRVDRRLVVSGTTTLQLDASALQLGGKLRVDAGLFDFSHSDAPTLSSDVYVLRPGDDGGPPPAPSESARKTRIALDVDLGDALQVRGHGFDARLAGTLRLSQEPGQNNGQPRLVGRVRTVGGHYAAYGQKLDITRGGVAFDGAYDNPRLDILALRPDLDQAVGVAVGGTAQSPLVRLYADPDMSDTDKLSWLLLGRASDGLGRTDMALLQRAAVALLSGEGDSPSGKLISRLGLDELSLRQSDDATTHDTIVGVGKQLSKAWYVGYERGLNATTGSWQLIYRLAQRLTVRAQTGDDNAIELIWQWRSATPAPAASREEP